MVIYQMKKPVESLNNNCVGVTGDNLAYTQEFYIKGVSDASLSYTLHLRFADGSVNSVTPDWVQFDGEGTGIRWVVKKNDIFMHGYFELQIEGRNEDGLVFQTEIISLYADESIPIEDKVCENPNSETLKLRDEAYELLTQVTEQQAKIDENVRIIEATDLSNKLDDADDVITSSHIAEGAILAGHIGNRVITGSHIASGTITGTKYASNSISASCIADQQIYERHIVNKEIGISKLSEDLQNTINSKYDASEVENGSGAFTISSMLSGYFNSASFEYQKVGNWVNLHVYVDFKKSTPVSASMGMTLTGLPFVCKNTVTPREMCITTQKRQMVWGIVAGSAGLTLIVSTADQFAENEKLSFSVRYKIA